MSAKAIRISYDSGEYFVSAKNGSNFKSDSVYHDINKAFNRAFALLEGDAKTVESQRLVARVRELEAQNAELLAVLKTAYEVVVDHDDRLPFDYAVYCEMLYGAIAQAKGSPS